MRRFSFALASLSLLFGSAVVLAACSSTATGSGGTSGTSGTGGGAKGLLGGLRGGGNGGTSGTTGGTSGTTGGTSGASGDICQATTGDDACTACGRAQCCSEVRGCFVTTPACGALLDCGATCNETDDACFDRCIQTYSTGRDAFQRVYGCLTNKCASPCELTPSTSSGSTSGASGTSGSSTSGSSTSGGTTSGAPPPPAG